MPGGALRLQGRPAEAADALSQEGLLRHRRVHATHQLRALIETFGVDHVVMGTDYPYDMAEYEPLEHLQSAELDATTLAQIAGLNAKKLLGL